jgi:hypothetical protein
MANRNPTSPEHFSITGSFTPEDIQELLGAMASENQAMPQSSDHPSSLVTSSHEEPGNENEFSTHARSERKRSREKQRRSDVNKQFNDLTQLLMQIESEEVQEESTRARLSFNPANRVDLIARTISHLQCLHEANKKRNAKIESLEQQLEQARKAGEDTASKLKEAIFSHPAGKQVCICLFVQLFYALYDFELFLILFNALVFFHPLDDDDGTDDGTTVSNSWTNWWTNWHAHDEPVYGSSSFHVSTNGGYSGSFCASCSAGTASNCRSTSASYSSYATGSAS